MPPAPAPYPLPRYARRKETVVAVLLSLFIPGAGQLYNGQIAKGLMFVLAWMVSFVLFFPSGVGVFTLFPTWICRAFGAWSMIDAMRVAEKINRGEIVV